MLKTHPDGHVLSAWSAGPARLGVQGMLGESHVRADNSPTGTETCVSFMPMNEQCGHVLARQTRLNGTLDAWLATGVKDNVLIVH
jgi:hypothetical protein